MIKLPGAVIFDWDNTLVDSWPAIAEAMNAMRAKLGHEQWTLDEIRARCTRAARDSFPEWFGKDWERAYEIYYSEFDEVRRKRDIRTLPGARELIEWLKVKNIPSYIVSNKRGDYLRFEVERLQWQDFFGKVAGAQDAENDKPHRDHVDFALQGSDIRADENVWFVGDSATDVLCARNANCTPVLVGDQEDAEKLGVLLSFDDCRGLLELLQSLEEDKA